MALSVSIELVSSSARVTSVKSHKGGGLTDRHSDTKIGPGTPGSDKNIDVNVFDDVLQNAKLCANDASNDVNCPPLAEGGLPLSSRWKLVVTVCSS